jgi:hypothetical protein
MKKLLILFLLTGAALKASTLTASWPLNGDTHNDLFGDPLGTKGTITFSTVGGRIAASGFSTANYLTFSTHTTAQFGDAHTSWQLDVDFYATSMLGMKTFFGFVGSNTSCGGGGGNFLGQFGSNVLGFESAGPILCVDETGGTWSTSTWHTISFVWDAGTGHRSIYLDGSRVGDDTNSGDYGSTVTIVDVGQAIDTPNGDAPWNGALSNVRFWTGAYCSGSTCGTPTVTATTTWTPTISPTPTYSTTPKAFQSDPSRQRDKTKAMLEVTPTPVRSALLLGY